MKKTYMQPSVEDIKISIAATILAGSPQPPTAGIGEGEVGAGEIESRRHTSVWDDDEEDF